MSKKLSPKALKLHTNAHADRDRPTLKDGEANSNQFLLVLTRSLMITLAKKSQMTKHLTVTKQTILLKSSPQKLKNHQKSTTTQTTSKAMSNDSNTASSLPPFWKVNSLILYLNVMKAQVMK